MFDSAKLQTIICTSNIQQAEQFYGDVLGLTLQGRSLGASVYNVGGTPLRVSPVPFTRPSEHTLMGFAVPDIASAIKLLRERGVTFERFPGFSHDESGVVCAPDGSRVAWFRDPDGNLLSVVQYLEP